MKKTTAYWTAAGALAIAASVPSAVTNAAPRDSEFLDRLSRVGVTSSNPYATVREAYNVCQQLDFGVPHSRVVDIVASTNPGLDGKGAADFVVLANMTFCPPG